MWWRWWVRSRWGDGRQTNGAEGEEEVESNRGGIERNPEDGWERDRLPRARKGERGEGEETATHAAGRTGATEKL